MRSINDKALRPDQRGTESTPYHGQKPNESVANKEGQRSSVLEMRNDEALEDGGRR